MLVTFCGHSELSERAAVREWLDHVLEKLISDGADTFYLGGYGAFDSLAAAVLREYKANGKAIKTALVLPYLNSNIDATGYDYTVYPPIETVPLRFAISKRNEWMIQESDIVVAYVTHGWGGAAKTLEYARRKEKRIIQFAESF